MTLSSFLAITMRERKISSLMYGSWNLDNFPIEVMELLAQIRLNKLEKELVNVMLEGMDRLKL